MALLLKSLYLGYFRLVKEFADPRADDLFLMSSPLPTIGIFVLWYKFISKWGPAIMKDREPLNLKSIMMVYNVVQVVANVYIMYYAWLALLARNVVSWRCTEIDYTRSYWGLTFLWFTHRYFFLKFLDLFDTIFFVLRKKNEHLSFLHIYHHSGMFLMGWVATKYIGGGHLCFLALANSIVHSILYSYYLLTAYDSKYSKLLWLKKFVTQIQLFQFVFVLVMFVQLLFVPECKFPLAITLTVIPQNLFMIVLFSDFYYQTYHIKPKKKRMELENKMQELQEKSEDDQEKKRAMAVEAKQKNSKLTNLGNNSKKKGFVWTEI